MNRLFRAVVVCVMALLGGCAQAPPPPPAPAPAPPPSPLACAGVGGAPMLEYELFFGRSIPRALGIDRSGVGGVRHARRDTSVAGWVHRIRCRWAVDDPDDAPDHRGTNQGRRRGGARYRRDRRCHRGYQGRVSRAIPAAIGGRHRACDMRCILTSPAGECCQATLATETTSAKSSPVAVGYAGSS